MKRRGRPPRSLEMLAVDARIGWAVHRLIHWGFAQDATCEVVGEIAGVELRRVDDHGRGLGADRIDQIYEEYLKVQGTLPMRWRITRRWLIAARPAGTLETLARKLLRDGSWRPDTKAIVTDLYGDHEVTPTDSLINGEPEPTPSALRAEESWPTVIGPKLG